MKFFIDTAPIRYRTDQGIEKFKADCTAVFGA